MVGLKLPEREFKGLLNSLRERIKDVYGISILGIALIKSILVQTFRTQLRRILPS